MIRVVVVDDEAPARRKMTRLLSTVADWQLVGEAGDVDSAVAVIKDTQPDVALLDIQLNNDTGFDVLDGLTEPRPKIVFVTAYDHYALKAFDVHAQDYLLKPVQQQRFDAMVDRVNTVLQEQAESPDNTASVSRNLAAMIEQLRTAQARPTRMLLEKDERSVFVDHDQILTIRSDGNYVIVQLNDAQYRQRGTLTQMISRLNPEQFAQINRSCIVNLQAIREIQTWFKGGRMIILNNGNQLKVSAHFWKMMNERLG